MQRTRQRTLAASFVLAATVAAAPALAQTAAPAPPADASPSSKVKLLTAYRFHLSLAHFSPDETAFKWDARAGGDFDIVEFGQGYVNLLVDLETVIGGEFRPFDPNQANYTLDATVGLRGGSTAGGFIFHHVSRHIIDRPKPAGVDWNVAGVRLDTRREGQRLRLDGRALGGKIVKRSFVDYTWELRGAGGLERDVSPRVTLRLAADLDYLKTDPRIAGRTKLVNRGIEFVMRVKGQVGAVELFLRGERRNDPIPREFGRRTWALVGFRFVNR